MSRPMNVWDCVAYYAEVGTNRLTGRAIKSGVINTSTPQLMMFKSIMNAFVLMVLNEV